MSLSPWQESSGLITYRCFIDDSLQWCSIKIKYRMYSQIIECGKINIHPFTDLAMWWVSVCQSHFWLDKSDSLINITWLEQTLLLHHFGGQSFKLSDTDLGPKKDIVWFLKCTAIHVFVTLNLDCSWHQILFVVCQILTNEKCLIFLPFFSLTYAWWICGGGQG